MQIRPAFLLLFFFNSLLCTGQKTITGIVVNGSTGEPLPGASIFVSNSSRGTVSNKTGNFELTDLPAGKQDLVISSIGFVTSVYSYNSDELPKKLRVQMEVKIQELENVTVEPSVLEGWDVWGTTFTDNFLGRTPNAQRCRIRNYKSIKFRYFKKSRRLIAWSDEPLQLVNNALGYTVEYQLENFEMNFDQNTTLFLGYPYFNDQGNKVRDRWQKQRDKSYNGSLMHFMRSLYANQLQEQGFEVRRMVRTENAEKQRVKALRRPVQTLVDTTRGDSDSTRVIEFRAVEWSPDSASYYERILKQDDYKDTYAAALLGADSLIVGMQGDEKLFWFPDYLSITYKREKEDLAYLQFWHQSRSPTLQQSLIWLPAEQPILVSDAGSYPPTELFSMGYWGWDEKMSNCLPMDYQPAE